MKGHVNRLADRKVTGKNKVNIKVDNMNQISVRKKARLRESPGRAEGRRSEKRLPGHAVQSETVQARDRSQTRRAERRADMLPEIAAAVGFLSSLLRTRGCVNEQRLQVFRGALQAALTEHYKHHWFPEKPSKGSGYRCIRINHKMDPIISKVASQIGLSQPQLHRLLPSELTLWVDPYEVSYRIGEDGSICVLYQEAPVATSYGLLTCKNQMILGRSSPSKNYIMAVSS
ncbi:hypothetical protein E5288_WYG010457 [Bos mutus]|uniref:Anti-proliferative protein domain-containing protein n=1 Tax=Bos mutus TaxID=72004 RepID=A0A6B0S404_9CETA|nr:hypothetical protein [Bos mutus]